MKNQTVLRKYDVIIVGAGPAGCACALTLRDTDLKVALFDKKSFPRDKVCGDAIPGRAIKTLKDISPDFAAAFQKFAKKCRTTKTRVSYKDQTLYFNWVDEAYTCARIDFDNFLFSLVKENTATEIFTDSNINEIIAEEHSISLVEKNNGIICSAPLIIGADGAQSVLAKQLTGRTPDRKHQAGSVRAYYANISDTKENITEVYFDKKFLPSYLWVFPLPGNIANVGFGMLSSEIAKRKINIKETFQDFITQTPQLAEKFKDARPVGELEGFGLPLGSRKVTVSGNGFMLTGDAASLIDPISGDGIGNAMLSGKLAAEQAIRSCKKNNFTASFIRQYDEALSSALGNELKCHFRMQQAISKMPFLLDTLFWASKNKRLKKLIQKNL